MVVNDLFLVQPMSSFSGYLTYMQYGLGTEKGGVGGRDENGKLKTIIQNESPFVYGKMTEDRARYTGDRVVEPVKAGAFVPAWGKNHKKVEINYVDSAKWVELEADSEGKFTAEKDGRIRYVYDNITVPQKELPTLVGHMEGITLTARARRIAVYYSQIAAYQA